jgi:hypothetical protein
MYISLFSKLFRNALTTSNCKVSRSNAAIRANKVLKVLATSIVALVSCLFII